MFNAELTQVLKEIGLDFKEVQEKIFEDQDIIQGLFGFCFVYVSGEEITKYFNVDRDTELFGMINFNNKKDLFERRRTSSKCGTNIGYSKEEKKETKSNDAPFLVEE